MTSEKQRILVAEDNPGIARVVQFNLQRAGYEVTLACNGRLALETAQQAEFDAVITDHQMPEMSGVDLCGRLRQLPGYADTPIVMLTAKRLELNHDRLKEESGVAALLPKPFSTAEVCRTLGELLA
jgi:two-component system chemotaxis response regulator CheY